MDLDNGPSWGENKVAKGEYRGRGLRPEIPRIKEYKIAEACRRREPRGVAESGMVHGQQGSLQAVKQGAPLDNRGKACRTESVYLHRLSGRLFRVAPMRRDGFIDLKRPAPE